MNTSLPIVRISDEVETHATYTCRTKNNTVVNVYMDIFIRDGYIINPSINVVCKQGTEQIKIVVACLQGWLIIYSFPQDGSTIINQMMLTGNTYIAIDTPTANLEENFSVKCLAYYVNKPAAKLTSE